MRWQRDPTAFLVFSRQDMLTHPTEQTPSAEDHMMQLEAPEKAGEWTLRWNRLPQTVA